jgi:hypothetical protein
MVVKNIPKFIPFLYCNAKNKNKKYDIIVILSGPKIEEQIKIKIKLRNVFNLFFE